MGGVSARGGSTIAAQVQENLSILARSSVNLSARERVARLLDRTIFFVLLTLIPLTAIPYGTVEDWWEAVFECIVFALAALWIIEAWLSGKWFVSEHRLLVPLLALLFVVFVQTVPFTKTEVRGLAVWYALSADPFETRLVAFRFLALIIVMGLLLRYTSSRGRLRALIYVVIGTGVACALFGVVRQAMQGDVLGFLLPRLAPGQGYGQFINYNHFAFLMEMTSGLAVGLAVGEIVRRCSLRRLLMYVTAAALMWTALVLSNSRGGVFAMLGQVFFLVLMFNAVRPRRRPREQSSDMTRRLWRVGRGFLVRAVLASCLLMVTFVGIMRVGGEPLAHRMGNLPREVSEAETGERDNTSRRDFWAATWKLIKANSVAGVGFGSYWVAVDAHYDASGNSTPQQAHNDYLELLASGGLVGVAFVVWFVAALVRQTGRCLRSKSSFRRAACLGALAGIFGVAVHSIVDFGLHVTANALVFTTLIVIATVSILDEKQILRSSEGDQQNLLRRLLSEINSRLTPHHHVIRFAVVAISLLVCLLGILTAGQAGRSRLLSRHAGKAYLLASADEAIRLTPADPAAHFVRAGVFMRQGLLPEALQEYERAVALRPHQYAYWLALGAARNWNNDQQGAHAAFSEAVRLAPYYATPRWQLGRFLLQTGQRDEAFTEFSRAVASDPKLLVQAADLIWEECGGDAGRVRQVIHPETISAKLALARYFDKRGVLKETLELFRQAGSAATQERLALLNRLLTERKFIEAYEVWSSGRAEGSAGDLGGVDAITNGGFEDDIDLNDQGFGWRQLTPNVNAVHVSLDANEPRAGSRSLHLEFRGDPSSDNTISKLVLVEARTNYRLRFAARTLAIVTGGLPVITVTDGNNAGQVLGQSAPLAPDSTGWQDYGVEFATTGTTSAVMIEIRRQQCARTPCPIFGYIWLDNFSLQKV